MQVITEQAKAGGAKAIYYLCARSGENGPEAWLMKALEKLAEKGDVEAMGRLASFLSFDKPADALIWRRIHSALTRIDPLLLEELLSDIYKELSAEQIAVAAQKAERWLEAHPQITKHSDFLRIVADADIETLDKDGNRIEQPRIFSDRDASNETSVLKGSKKPYTGMVRKFGKAGALLDDQFLQLEVNFLMESCMLGLYVGSRFSEEA